MPLPQFRDLNPYNIHCSYKVTNEETIVHQMLLKGLKMKFKRAGGIASGGEIPLLTLLPLCEEVSMIDHSMGALAICYLKAAMLAALGPRGMMSLFVDKGHKEFTVEAQKAIEHLPSELRAFIYFGSSTNKFSATITETDYKEIRREWFYTPFAALVAASKKLHKLTLLHGDLTTDLPALATGDGGRKFDCLYISNAIEHTGRDGKKFTLPALSPIVEEGGVLFGTRAYGSVADKYDSDWELLKSVPQFRSSFQWHYNLYRRRPPLPTPVAAEAAN